MEADKIKTADLLDIVFDGRNKAYGAYELRTNYNKRVLEGLVIVVLLTMLLFAASALSNRNKAQKQVLLVKDVELTEIKSVEKNQPPPPPPPPPPKVEPPKVQITKFTPPKIVKDNEVKEDERPPEQEKLQDTKIGAINQQGGKDEGIVAPPTGVEGGKGIVEAPKPAVTEDYEKTFVKVEIESEYPGGAAAWLRYLNKNLRYPEDAINNEIEGSVVVQFIVDKEGNVSDVQPVSGPELGGLREEAVRVIKRSGLWTPAIQNGRKVKSYKKQPVVFKLVAQ